MPNTNLLLLGTGQVARAVIEQSGGSRHIIASTRDPRRIFELAEMGVEPLIMPLPSAELVARLANDADILVSFPPDGSTDAILAPACNGARSIIYISSTGVYGKKSGKIDDSTEADLTDERMQPRLQAESIWKENGAAVLRAPGLYGRQPGLPASLAAGRFRMPADGSNFVSRIHLDDLASMILEIFGKGQLAGSSYVVGDKQPCPIFEVISWLCRQMNLPLPGSAPLSEVNPSLRGNRQIDSSRLRTELAYTLKYPSYKEGYKQILLQYQEKS